MDNSVEAVAFVLRNDFMPNGVTEGNVAEHLAIMPFEERTAVLAQLTMLSDPLDALPEGEIVRYDLLTHLLGKRSLSTVMVSKLINTRPQVGFASGGNRSVSTTPRRRKGY